MINEQTLQRPDFYLIPRVILNGCVFVRTVECKVGVVGCLKEAGALVHHYKTVGVPIPLCLSHLSHILLPYHCHRHHCNHQFWWNQNKLFAFH